MQTHRFILFFVLMGTAAPLPAQGPLLPSGTPDPKFGPTPPLDGSGVPQAGMKTLHQIEPRIDVLTLAGDASNTHIISQPGSYFLSGNLTGATGRHGIRITASGVSLDLAGFRVQQGTGSTLHGIVVTGSRVLVSNGLIQNWLGDGIQFPAVGTPLGTNWVRGVVAVNCGNGFQGGNATCFVGCTAADNTNGGFRGASDCDLEGCISRDNDGPGFAFDHRTVIRRCTSLRNATSAVAGITPKAGIAVKDDAWVTECQVLGTGGTTAPSDGILVEGLRGRIERNNVRMSRRSGIRLTVNQGFSNVFQNTVSDNNLGSIAGAGLITDAGNDVAPIQQVNQSAATVNPWANLTYTPPP